MGQAIILASFGALDSIIRESTINTLFEDIKSAFPNVEVRQAYTSNFIRSKLQAKGIKTYSIEEQINTLRVEGFDKIVILPSHLTPGEEFDYKIKIFANDDVEVLNPLFTLNGDTDFDKRTFSTIVNCFEVIDNEELVLIGHGSPHRHNPVYENLQRLADKQGLKIHIGVIEPTDTPNFDEILHRLKSKQVTNILIAPMLFNGGSHVSKDIAGNSLVGRACQLHSAEQYNEGSQHSLSKNSWKTRLIEAGFNVRICTEGLGSFESFRQLYIDKLKGVF